MTQPTDPRSEVLRAAGHTEAADLLERLNALDTPKAARQAQQPQAPASMTAEQARQREGEWLLDRMRADLGMPAPTQDAAA